MNRLEVQDLGDGGRLGDGGGEFAVQPRWRVGQERDELVGGVAVGETGLLALVLGAQSQQPGAEELLHCRPAGVG